MHAIYHKTHICRKLHCTSAYIFYLKFLNLQYLKFIYVITSAISTLKLCKIKMISFLLKEAHHEYPNLV